MHKELPKRVIFVWHISALIEPLFKKQVSSCFKLLSCKS